MKRKMQKEVLMEKMKSKPFRKEYFKHFFYEYCRYYFREYFTFATPPCLREIYEALEEGKNVFIEGFRGSAKTTIAQMYVSYCIAYKKRRNIMRYAQSIDNAEENLTYIANSFIGDTDGGERFVRDYGSLYYPEFVTRGGSKKLKRLDKFITENECYVRAMSLGTSPRGKNYTASDGKFRPDLLVFDDVDTVTSCATKKKIDKAFEFLLNEVLGGTTSNTQMIFLGNTIYEDGLVPRFREHIEGDKNRVIIRIPIYDKDRNIVWNRFVESDEEAEGLNATIPDINKRYVSLESERRRLGTISFGQNYLLVPMVKGQHIITRDMIQRDNNCRGYKFDKIQIGVDPAISEDEGSDDYGICVVGFQGDKRYILEVIGLNTKEKQIQRSTEVVRNLYVKWRARRVVVETVAFQSVLKTIFQANGLATETEKTVKDKVTRLMEKQALFETGKVYFAPGTDNLVEQLLAFPNAEHDDLVDAMMFGLHENKTRVFISSF